jgi:hypothetical protein
LGAAQREAVKEMAMSASWRFGRIGSMLVTLNYTWLLVGGLTLWILALIWLPRYAPDMPSRALWLISGLCVLIYAVGLLLAELARTAAAGIFSAGRPRNVHLFPFGAAAAYPLQGLAPGRAALAAVTGPLVLGLLGLGYFTLARVLSGTIPWAAGGALRGLALLHVGAALLNLLPGLPLAGGWLLVAAIRSFSGAPTGGLGQMRALGFVVALGLAGAGAVVVLRDGAWPVALGLVALGWALREGLAVVTQRALTREMLEHITAGVVMQAPAPPVRADASLATVMWRAGRVRKETVVPVQDARGQFVGLLPLALADDLLQGTWATTPVADVMLPAAALPAVDPRTPLPTLIAAFGREARTLPLQRLGAAAPDVPLDRACVPVLQHGVLRGVICWAQVEEYERLAAGAGVQEAIPLASLLESDRPRLAWVGLLTALFVAGLILAAGSPAPSYPAGAVDAAPLSPAAITFGRPVPAAGTIVGRGDVRITIPISAPAPLAQVKITFDGNPLTVSLVPGQGNAVTASAVAPGYLLGLHTIRVTGQTEDGNTQSTEWTIRIAVGATQPK